MKRKLIPIGSSLLAAAAALVGAGLSLQAADPESSPTPAEQQTKKPNILFIMGDDIGIMQPGIYHRGLMVGETPNIDRIGNEGGLFMDYSPCRVAPPGAAPLSPARTRFVSD